MAGKVILSIILNDGRTGSDGDEVRIWIHCLLRCEHSPAALLVRNDAEEQPAFLTDEG
jgi:hypothetical protein